MGQLQISDVKTTAVQPSSFVARSYSFEPQTLDELLAATPEQLASCDIARMNLLCATGLPGAENLDIEKYLRRLDFIAKHVHKITVEDLRRFRENPKWLYKKGGTPKSENDFRMAHLANVIQHDFKMQYDSRFIRDPKKRAKWDWRTAFADSRSILIHGLLGEKRAGIYTPLSIVGVALGRRLGYPVYLTGTPHYDFVRWDSGDEWFNAEILDGYGRVVYSNDEYHKWPQPMVPEEEDSGYYLRNYTPVDELALCLFCRARVLMCNARFDESIEVWSKCCLLAPKNPEYPRKGKTAVMEAMFLRKHKKQMEWEGKRWLKPVTVVEDDPRKVLTPRLAAMAIAISAHAEESTQNWTLALRRFRVAMETDPANPDHETNHERLRFEVNEYIVEDHIRRYHRLTRRVPPVKLPPLEEWIRQIRASLEPSEGAEEEPPDKDRMHQRLLNARMAQSLSHQRRGEHMLAERKLVEAQIAFAKAFFGGNKSTQHEFVDDLREAITREVEQIEPPKAMWLEDEDANPRLHPFYKLSDELIGFIWHNRARVLEKLTRYIESANAYEQASKLSPQFVDWREDKERLAALVADPNPEAIERAKAYYRRRFEPSELEQDQEGEEFGRLGHRMIQEGRLDLAQAAFVRAHWHAGSLKAKRHWGNLLLAVIRGELDSPPSEPPKEDVLSALPNELQGYIHAARGKVLAAMGRPGRAAESYKRAYELVPGDPDLHWQIIALQEDAKKPLPHPEGVYPVGLSAPPPQLHYRETVLAPASTIEVTGVVDAV